MEIVLYLLPLLGIFRLVSLDVLDLCQINDHLQHDFVEQEGVDFEVILVALLVLVDRDVGHYLYRLVDVLKLVREVFDAPVGHPIRISAAAVGIESSQGPVRDGEKLGDLLLAFLIALHRMAIDTNFLLGICADHQRLLRIFISVHPQLDGLVHHCLHEDLNVALPIERH